MSNIKKGIFYILPSINSNAELSFKENFACHLSKIMWRSGKSILIACENKNQALKINNSLWNVDNNSFLPNDLLRKNTHYTPITIYWEQCCYHNNLLKDTLINLMKINKDFFFNFNEIIDFVPSTNILKKLARIRYKTLQNIGFDLKVSNTSNFKINNINK
ncbi:DNA polymerase III chi subunit [Candidatus Blochmanniella vafra str. BVAF]|uniref:DNA polymerase III chi subunit n=1 Tax=Blochmanniella vafra (strain BVAF) TaxID=859654 RepID=E8Q6K6_BLOVB|nr:DNA polymerase III subunit chi [Candidatus Blochmannia vafer]ADV33447.1 DNA polymerase III chi subunit [Candidatus Blochmannia vafer str. BVAF]